MRLTAYLRVSTEGQAEHGHGLDIQRDLISQWAENHQESMKIPYDIEAWHSDDGISGKNGIAERPGLEDAIASVKFNGSEGIVISTLDRLARSLTVQEGILAAVWESGGKVFTTDTGEVLEDDINDPMRTAIRQMRGVFNQLEAAMVRSRLHRGRMAKRAGGGYIGGAKPYGKTVDAEGNYQDVPAEQSILRLIDDMHSHGDSLGTIANYLNDAGYPTKNGGARWYKSTVRGILQRIEGQP